MKIKPRFPYPTRLKAKHRLKSFALFFGRKNGVFLRERIMGCHDCDGGATCVNNDSQQNRPGLYRGVRQIYRFFLQKSGFKNFGSIAKIRTHPTKLNQK
jgi:hypothetical protein